MTKTATNRVKLVVCLVLLAGALAPAQEHVQLVPQLGVGNVSSIAVSPDGRLAITGSNTEGAARLWDLESGYQIRVFQMHDTTRRVGFSGDGRSVVVADATGVHIFDVRTGSESRTITPDYPGSVTFSLDGHRMISRGSLWSLDTGQRLLEVYDPGLAICSVGLSLDGRFAVTGNNDGTARLWDAAAGHQIRVLSGHTRPVVAVGFSPDAQRIVTVSEDQTVRLWDFAAGTQVSVQPSVDTAHLGSSVAFSPDGRSFLTAVMNGEVHRWDSVTGRPLATVTLDDLAVCLAYSADGRTVLVGGNRAISILDASTLQRVRKLVGHTREIRSVAFSSKSGYLITGSEGSAGVWDLATGQQSQFLDDPFPMTFGAVKVPSPVTSVGFMQADHYVLTVSSPAAHIWDMATGKKVRSLFAQDQPVLSAVSSPDGHLVLTGSYEGIARLWNADTGEQVLTFDTRAADNPSPSPIERIAFTPDGALALVGSDTTPTGIWSAATGQPNRSFSLDSKFSDDGRYVLTSELDTSLGEWTQHLWSAENGQPVSVLDHDFAPGASIKSELATSSSNGRYLVTKDPHYQPDVLDRATGRMHLNGADDHYTVSVWEATTGRLIRTLSGHSKTINSVAISSDDRFLLTGSNDTTTRICDFETGKELAVLLSFENGGWAVTDPEGRYDSSDPDNTPGLVWVADGVRPIELAQLKDDYYTPNLLARILKGERLPDVTGLDRISSPPEVKIASPWNPQTRHTALNVRDTGGGVGRVVVSVNNRSAAVLNNQTTANGGSEVKLAVDLSSATLRLGENILTAYACDASNHIRSRLASATFTVAAVAKGTAVDADANPQHDYKPQFYAIVIGTARYGNPAMNLQYPEHDVESMASAIKIGAGHLFGADNTHLGVLTTAAQDEQHQPTKKNIVAAFNEVQQRATATDVLFVYLSGHGVSMRGQKDLYYYLTADARTPAVDDDPTLKDLSTVSSSELRQWLGAKDMPLKEVLVLDTCAAGAAGEELARLAEKREVPPDQRRAIEFLKDSTGTVVLMGSAADKSSYEASRYGQGLLTYALLDGMRGRSVTEGGQLIVSRWFQNASQEVPVLAASIGGIQKPVIAAHEGESFPVALLDPSEEAKIPLAAVKPQLLHLSCHDDNDEDPLGLGAAVRERLREISLPSVRGASESPIVYLDDVHEGPVDTLTPKIVYRVMEKKISLRLRLDRNNKMVKEENIELSGNDLKALGKTVAARFVAMAAGIPAENADR